jgi:multiple sugar transport system permease protein
LVGGNAFVGLENYVGELTNADFWSAFGNIVVYVLVLVPVMMCLGLFAALALDSGRLHGSVFFRLSLFLPYAVPGVVAALMWGYMYGSQFGLVGNLNEFFGWAIPNPLSNELVLGSIGNITLWLFLGYNMLIFYAALRVVPEDVYEAAELDGASAWRVISSIKLPAIRPVVAVTTMFSVIGSFQLFNEPNILRALAPNVISTHFTPNLYAYNLAFAGQQFNLSATVAIIMGVFTLVVAYLVQRVGNRKAI